MTDLGEFVVQRYNALRDRGLSSVEAFALLYVGVEQIAAELTAKGEHELGNALIAALKTYKHIDTAEFRTNYKLFRDILAPTLH